MLLPGDEGTECKNRQKRNSIADQTDEKSPAISQPHVFVGISSIENKRSQFLTCNQDPAAQKSGQ